MSQSEQIQTPPAGAIRNFAQLIGAIEEGEFNQSVTEAIDALTLKLNDRMLVGLKAKGAVTIKINFVADRGAIDVTADYSVKEPVEPRGRTVLYIANNAFLSTRDPRQQAMTVRVADGARPELRVDDGETAARRRFGD